MRFSLSSLLLSLILLLTGLFLVLLSWWDLFRLETIHLILNYPYTWMSIGISLIFASLGILYIRQKSAPMTTVKITSGELTVEIADSVLKSHLDLYFSSLFQNGHVYCDVTLFQDRLKISAFVPEMPLDEQKARLQQIERDLPWYLCQKTGLARPIELSFYSANIRST